MKILDAYIQICFFKSWLSRSDIAKKPWGVVCGEAVHMSRMRMEKGRTVEQIWDGMMSYLHFSICIQLLEMLTGFLILVVFGDGR